MRWVVYWSLFVASFKMFVRNRAALFFSLFVPLLIMLIFGVLNFGGSTSVSLGLVDQSGTDGGHALVAALQANKTFDLHPGTKDAELAQLKDGHRDLVLSSPGATSWHRRTRRRRASSRMATGPSPSRRRSAA